LKASNTVIRALATGAVALALVAARASAQIPDKFTNLKVLPPDITKDQLVRTMRSFNAALGVKCDNCHAARADDPKNLDFASDAKDDKKAARAMVTMTQEINGKLLPAAFPGGEPYRVQCVTCHRGLKHPDTLAEVLTATTKKEGLDAAFQKYSDLRAKYHGSGSYDFGPATLSSLAETLAAEKNLQGALAVAEFNAKANPDSAASYLALSTYQQQSGNLAGAIASAEKAAALDPKDDSAQRRLQQLRNPPSPR
jgi:tetratricopeptide (TPR) repeat protein